MKIGFLVRHNTHTWGGDIAVVNSLMQGLTALGHEPSCGTSAFSMADADILFLTNSTIDQRQHLEDLHTMGKPFGVLGFHEDILLYFTAAMGMTRFVYNCLGYGFSSDNGIDFDIDLLFEMPNIVYYYGEPPKRTTLYNKNLIKNALVWIANSSTEADVMQRDCPGCKTAVVPVAPGMVTSFDKDPGDSFLKFSGLASQSYLLQIGRLEMRKNQLGTILASRNFDMPLVFIATRAFIAEYEVACFEAAVRYRKAPTLFISENLHSRKEGSASVIPMPEGKKLPASMLMSAYHHAGLHIHPAFHELPGATYLEAARMGTPTIASSWCTINDYFYDPQLGHAKLDGRIVYVLPHHLNEIEKAIHQNFGKRFAPLINHPAISRTDIDAAKDFLKSS